MKVILQVNRQKEKDRIIETFSIMPRWSGTFDKQMVLYNAIWKLTHDMGIGKDYELIERKESEADRRVKNLNLTKLGQKAFAEATKIRIEFENEFLSLCDSVISLSNLTFAHKIATLILSEQIFRSLSIINNHPYHK